MFMNRTKRTVHIKNLKKNYYASVNKHKGIRCMGKIRVRRIMKKSFSYTNPNNPPKPLILTKEIGAGDSSSTNTNTLGLGSSSEIRSQPRAPTVNLRNDNKKRDSIYRNEDKYNERKEEPMISTKFIHPESDDDDDDDGEVFAKSMNGIILQYLEACGLTESYTTFYDECKSSGMLIPSQFRAELESGITLQDVETLMMHFDQENGDALLELWELLTGMVDEGEHSHEVGKITFYIQVYIALIPFRQRMSEEKKSASMSQLRAYFETQSEKCTMDKEMLALFALPFVPDPESHPVFGNLFQVAWIKKLRSRIKSLARTLCCPNKMITREETDLAKMFKICSKAVPHEIESADGTKICVFSNVEPMQFTSGAAISSLYHSRNGNDDFSPTHLFQRMNDLILENERYKSEESKYEKQCAQLLNVSLLLAQSLEEAAQGKEVNMDKLRHEVNQCMPISIAKEEHANNSAPNTTTTVNKEAPRATSPNSSDGGETFDQSPLFEVEDAVDKEAPEKGQNAKPNSNCTNNNNCNPNAR